MSEPQTVTQAAFGRLIGKGRSYITALKNADRLVIDSNGLVLVEASKKRIDETKGWIRDDVAERHANAKGVLTVSAKNESKPESKKGDHQFIKAEAIAREAVAKADLAEMERDEKRGKLIDKEEVDVAVADLVTTFRQSLENMPHRTAPELVGKDLDAIRATLKQEIHAALAEMEREFTKRIETMGSEE